MMTFKELKKLVKLPLYKEQRVPTVKALEESGVSVVAEKILENHGSISVYQNGYVIYRAHKRVTVFSLRNCVHYKYDALEGAGHHIEEEEFDEYEWHIPDDGLCGDLRSTDFFGADFQQYALRADRLCSVYRDSVLQPDENGKSVQTDLRQSLKPGKSEERKDSRQKAVSRRRVRLSW